MSYAEAKAKYAALGVDTDAAIAKLKTVPVALHCWQGDDVRGFDTDPTKPLTGGIQTTGNYPGRAGTPEELMADLDQALKLCPGTKKLNLHASYAIFEPGEWADRDRLARAIYNLIASAVRHTQEGAEITLSLLTAASVAVIEIHDPAAPGDRLRGTLDLPETRSEMKTIDADAGFGFAIARAIARSHGGTLIVGAGDKGGTTAAMSLSLQTPDRKTQELHAATAKFDYTGGFRQELIELSDVLPASVFDTVNID